MDNYFLKNKVALVTGGAGGIGRATVKKLSEAGADVVIHYHTAQEGAEALCREISGNPGVVRADISNVEHVTSMCEYIREKYGHIDILVNNAAVIKRSYSWDDHSEEDWHTVFDVNVIGVWQVIKQMMPLFSDGGAIVNVSSIYGVWGSASEIAYSLSKASIIQMTEILAKELAPRIRVNTVIPGSTLTKMVPDSEKLRRIESATLLKRSAKPEEIADSILFLSSPCSSYITGNSLFVDGGYHIK